MKTNPMSKKIIIHLLSGGMDSVVLLHDLHNQGHNIHCVLFDYGQKHRQELMFAKAHCQKFNLLFTTVTLPQLRGSTLTGDTGTVVVPFRNPIMLSIAVNLAVTAGADTVTIGCNKDDEQGFPDCRRAFLDSFNAMTKACGYHVEVCAPYLDEPKWRIAAVGREMGVQLWDTWSCYEGGEKPCGVCPACVKRNAAINHVV